MSELHNEDMSEKGLVMEQDNHVCEQGHDHGDHCCEHSHGHSHDHEHHHEHGGDGEDRKKEIIKLIVAAVLFALGLLVQYVLKAKWCVIIYAAAYLVAGLEVLKGAVDGIREGDAFSEEFLMSIASIGAFCVGEYAEACAVMVLYCLGELLQDLAVDKSRESITELMDIRPDYANLVGAEGTVSKVDPNTVNIGDVIVIKAGEKVPLDGTAIEGSAILDTAALTGESDPRDVKTGDSVLSGCICTKGEVKLQVTKEFGESTASKILELVENASENKSQQENFVSKFAHVYTPIVCGLAVLVAIVPPLLLHESFTQWLYTALTFLVVSCPCAIVISVPLSYYAGIGAASREGILVKGSNYLEAIAKAETAVFDKTGTLTVDGVIKPDAREALKELKELGVKKTVMLSGDKREIAEKVGNELAIDEIHYELLPADKLELMESMLTPDSVLMYTGDGINDAPSLARSDVGVAMGALGTDAAVEAADIVIMDDKLTRLPLAIKLARRTVQISRQNVAFALIVKVLVMILSMMGYTNMWLAVFSDVGVALLCVLNSMRNMKKIS